jgi:hypothetical protein
MSLIEAKPSFGRYLVSTILGLALFIVVTRLAVAGTLPGSKWSAVVLIPLLLLFTAAMLFRAVGA